MWYIPTYAKGGMGSASLGPSRLYYLPMADIVKGRAERRNSISPQSDTLDTMVQLLHTGNHSRRFHHRLGLVPSLRPGVDVSAPECSKQPPPIVSPFLPHPLQTNVVLKRRTKLMIYSLSSNKRAETPNATICLSASVRPFSQTGPDCHSPLCDISLS